MKKFISIILSGVMLFTVTSFPFYAFSEGDGEAEILPHEHPLEYVEAVEPDCENGGTAAYYYCAECEKMFADENAQTELTDEDIVLEANGHSLNLVKAVAETCTKNGSRAYFVCSECGKAFKYSNTSKETTPADEVIPRHDHRLAFKSAVAATFEKNGLTEGAYCYECKAVIVPQKTVKKYGAPKFSKVKKGKKRAVAVWKEVSGVDGYVLQVSLYKSFKKKSTYTVKNQETVKKTVTGLKSKKKYYFRIRAYKKISGTKKYSKWSAVKSVKIK